jgi:hypothetical protein
VAFRCDLGKIDQERKRTFCSEKGNTIKEQELRRRAVILRKKLERKKRIEL